MPRIRRDNSFPTAKETAMAFLSPALAETFAGYIVNRRDKRIITFSVLALYATALLYHLAGAAFGAPPAKAALDSVEVLAAVVVVAHIAGGTAQRAVAQRAATAQDAAPKAGGGSAP